MMKKYVFMEIMIVMESCHCLLYTSDAADEL